MRSTYCAAVLTAAVVMLGFGAWGSAAAEAQQSPVPLHTVATNVPGIYAFTQPPAGFDARRASDETLLAWGYPPRPRPAEGAEELAKWEQSVSPGLRRVIPQLQMREGVYNRPLQDFKADPRPARIVNTVAATSSNWSGISLVRASGAQPFSTVRGAWIVPTVRQPPRVCSGGWDYSSQWVGIDGFLDQYLLQAGSAANVYCDIGNNITEYYPWIEWLPAAAVVLYQNASTQTLLPFAAGDYVVVTVTATNFVSGVSTTGTLQFVDVTQNWTTSLSFTAASLGGSQVTGGSAEWILERTEVDGAPATLPDYVANAWTYARAEDLAANFYYPGTSGTATAYQITMQDINNANVSFVDLFGPQVLWFFPEGSATQ